MGFTPRQARRTTASVSKSKRRIQRWPRITAASAAITPVLDVMQTMPTFVYLIPIVLFFGIGTSGAVAATIIYALPPVIRITGHGIRSVDAGLIVLTAFISPFRAERDMVRLARAVSTGIAKPIPALPPEGE